MNVALSFMIVFKSSDRSVNIQSSFRGNIAVSREAMVLFFETRLKLKGRYFESKMAHISFVCNKLI